MTAPALSVKQVAELLDVSQHQILSLLKSGELRGVDVSLQPGGRPRWRIMADDLDAFPHRRAHQIATPRRRRRGKPTSNITQYF